MISEQFSSDTGTIFQGPFLNGPVSLEIFPKSKKQIAAGMVDVSEIKMSILGRWMEVKKIGCAQLEGGFNFLLMPESRVPG